MKKLISILLSIVVIAAMVGCSKEEPLQQSPTTAPTNVPAVTGEAEATKMPQLTGEPEVTQEPQLTGEPVITAEPAAEPTKAPVTPQNPIHSGIPVMRKAPEALAVKVAQKEFYGNWSTEINQYEEYTVAGIIGLDSPYEKYYYYPSLQNALEEYSIGSVNQAKEALSRLEGYALDDEAGPYGISLYADTSVILRRADSSCISFLEYSDEYLGGVHGMYGVWGYNFDSQTGEMIGIGDVVADYKAFAQLLYNRLMDNYSDTHVTITVEDIEDYMNEERINWTLDYDGITCYWNPYEIASFADGILSAKILFSEAKEVLTKTYDIAPLSYMVPVNYLGYNTDIDGDGILEEINVYPANSSEFISYEELRISVNDNEYVDDNAYGYESETYYVKTPSGSFIYFFGTQDSDDAFMKVYAINGEGVTSESGYLGYDMCDVYDESFGNEDAEAEDYVDGLWYEVIYNPDNMYLSHRNDILGTMFLKAHYSVGEDGIPKVTDTFYETARYDIDFLVDLVLDVVDKDTGEIIITKLFEAGQKGQPFRSDGEYRVDFELDDGTCVAVDISDIYKNNLTVSDCFGGVSFAD